jgi:glucose/arabinose dehydrogenase
MRSRIRALCVVLAMIAGALVVASPANAAPRFDVLVFSKVNGFYHDSIPAGVAAIQQLGTQHNFAVTVSDDSSIFTDAGLASFEAVVFNNTNGRDGAILDTGQRAAFERYIHSGRGFVGIHSASGTEYDWAWYQRLLGATFKSHPAVQQVTIQVDDRVHPSTTGLPQAWVRTEEPYDFTTVPRGDVHVLASFDTRSYTGHTMGADHPIAWCQNFEGGRSWYTGLGHHASAYTEPLFVSHLRGGIEWAAGGMAGDCGGTDAERFEKIQLDGNTDDPLDLAVDSAGRVFYVERGGAVKVYDPVLRATVLAARFDVLVQHTHGMHGIVLDPGFATNKWLYLYYSPLNDTVARVSRFTFNEATDTVDKASERVLLRINSQRTTNAHEGGGMAFDPAGNLYVGTGDNSSPCCSGFGPIDERPGQEVNDAQRSSGNTNDLRGKILRIRPQADGTYAIPAGNLFPAGTANTRPEIYVMGVRQPYRISVDAETGWLYWGDVGPDASADTTGRGSMGFDEFNQARTAGNYGWPYCIGANRPYNDFNFATNTSGPLFNCTAGPTNNSPNNTGQTTLPPARGAWIPYPYGVSATWPELGNGGRLAVGGPTYHFDAASTSETKFPQYFDDALFVADWTRNAIFEVRLDASGNPFSMNRFLPRTTFLRPIDMEFGPDGSMYLIEWGTNYGGSGRGDPNFDSGVYRINYVNPGARSPIARATATPTNGQAPLTVAFSSAGSTDPDPGSVLTYAWDFTSNGSTDSTAANPTFTYTANGNFSARLTVTDQTGRSNVVNLPITVGNTAPTVTLTGPLDGQVFDFGGQVTFGVTVTDPEDGTVECGRVTVQPALGHAQHAHPLDLYHGCTGTIQTIVDDGHTSNDNLFYVVDAKYTDRGAGAINPLTGGDSAILQPRHKEADHFTRSQGIQLVDVVAGNPAGGQMIGHVANGDWISFEPVNLLGVDALRFRVASGGSGGTIEVRRGSPTGPLLGSAAVANTGGWRTFTTVTANVTDPGGSSELYLVFRNTSTTGDLFNVDWLEFVPLVEVTSLSLPPAPLFGARTVNATVSVANRSAAAVNATVRLDVPAGWASAPVTASVAAGATATVTVPFTPVGGAPVPGFVAPPRVTARATATGTTVGGAPIVATFVAPAATDVGRALDLGTATSPLTSGYARLAHTTAYSDATGFGWATTNGLQSRDRGGPDALRADMATAQLPGTLRLKVPAGRHLVSLLRGDQGFAAQRLLVTVDGARVVDGGAPLGVGQWGWEQFVVDGGGTGRAVDIGLRTDVPNEWWRVNAVVVQPVTTVYALDAGSATSPLAAGYSRLANTTAYANPPGFGWIGAGPQSRDRGAPDALRQDIVTSTGTATLRLSVPAGRHRVGLLRGDQGFAAERIVVTVDGQRVVDGGMALTAAEFGWDQFTVDGGAAGRTVDVTFTGDPAKFWRFNAIVVWRMP